MDARSVLDATSEPAWWRGPVKEKNHEWHVWKI